MPAVILGAPGPVFVDPSQGTPGAPSPTMGAMTVQGVSGMYPVSVAAGITGPVAISNFPQSQVVTGAVGVVGPVGITGPVGVTGTVAIVPLADNGVLTPFSFGSDNRLRVGQEVPLFYDPIDGNTVNTAIWTQSQSGMTQSQSSGSITLNSGSALTSGAYSILQSNPKFQNLTEFPIYAQFRAKVVFQTNAIIEMGFGTVSGASAPTDGVFFRVDGTGAARGVINFGGTETITSVLATLSSAPTYSFEVFIFENYAKFEITSSDGTVDVSVTLQIPNAQATVTTSSHLPVYARVYNASTTAAAAQVAVAAVNVQQLDAYMGRTWPDTSSSIGHWSNINPNTFAQAAQLATGSAPTAGAPTPTGCLFSTLGGEFLCNMTASSENNLGVFGFQVPSPYTLKVTGININPPVVTTAMTTTATIQEWSIMVASSNVPSQATGFKLPLGMFTAAASAAVATVFNGQPINPNLTTPITVFPGMWLLVLVKVISGTTTGAYRGVVVINGYYE